MFKEEFVERHLGIEDNEVKTMLPDAYKDLDTFINQIIPKSIHLKKELDLPLPLSEDEYKSHIQKIGQKNLLFNSFIGQGFYPCITPPVINRNILENPGWYTQYTPYQAEISQGRLEALLNFQTMISDLTGLPIANASLLDEATAAVEAMTLLFRMNNNPQKKSFFISDQVFATTVDVVLGRAKNYGINCVIGNIDELKDFSPFFGLMLQYPEKTGRVQDYSNQINIAKQEGVGVCVACDILALALLKPPGEWGADIVFGSTQRFGMPMGLGGPHAAFFSCKEEMKRLIPGRIIGITKDARGKKALRMALQTREQHIRRDKATSNICTAQALPAIVASMFAVWHGPKRIRQIAENVHALSSLCYTQLKSLGVDIINDTFFDTFSVQCDSSIGNKIREIAEQEKVNFYYTDAYVSISFDETKTEKDIETVISIFEKVLGKKASSQKEGKHIPANLQRDRNYLQHPIFNSFHSEHEFLRYTKLLENKDLSLCHSMIPLGSCTMKLNASTEMATISLEHFANIHPFAPKQQTLGYEKIIQDLEQWLCKVTGFSACSLQPNSGAQGEYAGLQTIKNYLAHKGEEQRNIVLIPKSAHGTNPASAVCAGMKIVLVNCDAEGNIETSDLQAKAEQNKEHLACLMITYPSTHGIFEENILEICQCIHKHGGLIYMDGANLNAQVGLTSPATIGADVCHINLHKTFCIPHGGGGPGMGPICVAEHLAPFLPAHHYSTTRTKTGQYSPVASAEFGSALILLISHAYIAMMGAKGLKKASQVAILNANYIKQNIEKEYKVLYTDKNGFVGHELIVDCREFGKYGIEVKDIAKRLMDYSFHAPTVSFPVPGTLMIEPTESESIKELNRFCSAMLSIRNEIRALETEQANKENNLLKNAPHTLEDICSASWDKPYSKEEAFFPVEGLKESKFIVPVGRVDDAYGDRNLVCTCEPFIEE